MKQNHIWHIDSDDSKSAAIDLNKNSISFERVTCPMFDGHQRAGKRIGDLHVLLKGHAVPDIVWTWYSDCLIQDRVRILFEIAGITGYRLRPVKVTQLKGDDVVTPVFWELQLTGWGGIASEKSGITLDRCCEHCKSLHYSEVLSPEYLFDVDNWDGSDMFMIWPLPKYIFTVDRVAKLIRNEKITGVELRRIEDLKKGSATGYSPGRLSYHMPIERAREIGEPLNIF